MKNIFILSLFFVFAFASSAQAAKNPTEYYLDSGSDIALTAKEKAALAVVEKWTSGQAKEPVTTGKDGSVQFVFGLSQPSILCAVLQVTDIELEAGEQVYNLHLGDTARWMAEPALTGVGAAQIQHVIVKPKDSGIETSLVITTDRRTYHLKLRASKKSYYPRVSFNYPETMLAKWNAIQSNEARQIERGTMPETGEYLGDLSFDYKISGSPSWKPLRVYNDGIKTIIQMPKEIINNEAPTLLVVRDGEQGMVNYRLQGDRYIVDQVFDKAIMIVGVGSKQQKVTITKGKGRSSNSGGTTTRFPD